MSLRRLFLWVFTHPYVQIEDSKVEVYISDKHTSLLLTPKKSFTAQVPPSYANSKITPIFVPTKVFEQINACVK
jgi:hypothetical protein